MLLDVEREGGGEGSRDDYVNYSKKKRCEAPSGASGLKFPSGPMVTPFLVIVWPPSTCPTCSELMPPRRGTATESTSLPLHEAPRHQKCFEMLIKVWKSGQLPPSLKSDVYAHCILLFAARSSFQSQIQTQISQYSLIHSDFSRTMTKAILKH